MITPEKTSVIPCPAVQRGVDMLKVPFKDMPVEAVIYVGYLCQKYGMCMEVMLTGYVVYAQIVEDLACDDELYLATPDIRGEWMTVQREWERISDETTSRIRVQRKSP